MTAALYGSTVPDGQRNDRRPRDWRSPLIECDAGLRIEVPREDSASMESHPAPAAQERPRVVLFVVFATILIDFAGFSVLIPVLPLYAGHLGANGFEIGLIVTLYALAQLLFLPAWGWVSDRMGRRPVLLFSLAGTVGAYLLLVFTDTLEGIYLARILAGFFAAAIGTAQAVVTDVTSREDRARGMGRIGAAMGLGLVMGPAVGGLLGAVDQRLPFVCVAAIAAVNFFVAWWFLPETKIRTSSTGSWSGLLRTLVPVPLRVAGAVHDRRIGLYLYLFFHVSLGFSALESLLPTFLDRQFDVSPLEVGILFATLGVVMVVTQGFLIGPLTRRHRESRLVVSGFALCALGLVAIDAAPSLAALYGVAVVIGLGYGLAYPTFTSLYSQACEAGEAGELLGDGQSMATSGRIVGPMWAGWVIDWHTPGLTFVIAGVIVLIGLALFAGARRWLVDAGH
jgi:multidrug resistance protein